MTLKLKVIQGVALKYTDEPLSGSYPLFCNDTEAPNGLGTRQLATNFCMGLASALVVCSTWNCLNHDSAHDGQVVLPEVWTLEDCALGKLELDNPF